MPRSNTTQSHQPLSPLVLALNNRARRLSRDPAGQEELKYVVRAIKVLRSGSRRQATPRAIHQDNEIDMRRTPAESNVNGESRARIAARGPSDTSPFRPSRDPPRLHPSQRPPQHARAAYPEGPEGESRSIRQRLEGRLQLCRRCDMPSLTRILTAPCGHIICCGCISAQCRDLIDSTFPLQCCSLAIPHSSIEDMLSPTELSLYRARKLELEISREERLYCQNWASNCSTFLGSRGRDLSQIQCPGCRSTLCRLCQHPIHPRQTCAERAQMENSQRMDGFDWKNCPGCQKPVEQPSSGKIAYCTNQECQKCFCFECLHMTLTENHPCSEGASQEESPFLNMSALTATLDLLPIFPNDVASDNVDETTTDPPPPQSAPAATFNNNSSAPARPWEGRAHQHRNQTRVRAEQRRGANPLTREQYEYMVSRMRGTEDTQQQHGVVLGPPGSRPLDGFTVQITDEYGEPPPPPRAPGLVAQPPPASAPIHNHSHRVHPVRRQTLHNPAFETPPPGSRPIHSQPRFGNHHHRHEPRVPIPTLPGRPWGEFYPAFPSSALPQRSHSHVIAPIRPSGFLPPGMGP